jgi:2,4-dienoyl-CoA reductase-like NADH-dependent reductase (Old Yellow Enzyme family)
MGPLRAAREMSVKEIGRAIQAYGQAARRAQAAGFDAVQIHAAHGYLIGQFLSPLTNHRTDDWGGSQEKRMRFLREVVGEVRAQVGPEFPVLIKLGIRDEVETGLSLSEGTWILSQLPELGIDAAELSGGLAVTPGFILRPGVTPGKGEAYYRTWAHAAKDVADVPILLVGGLRSRQTMEDVLESGDAMLISLCRPLICEPDLPNRLAAGQEAASCVSCNRCWPTEPGRSISCKHTG